MKALHVFPLFSKELTNGSEYYEYQLSRKLVQRGVTVDVLSTRADRFRHTSLLSLEWRNDLIQAETSDGMGVRRFPSWSMPQALGQAVSRATLSRWRAEDERFGVVMKGSRGLVDDYHRRTLARPLVYDWMAMAGLGPWPIGLLAHAARVLHRYDVVLVGFLPFALVCTLTALAKALGKPVVTLALFHPDDQFHHHRVFYRALARADAVLTQTPYSTNLLRRLFPGCRPFEVGCGTHLLEEPVYGSGDRFRQKYGFGTERLALFVGRKEHGKRYDLAVEAVRLAGNPRLRLVMIGGDHDGRLVDHPFVSYLGRVPREDLVDAYEACDVLLMPSEHESFGIVFLEAWAHRKPVIGNSRCHPVATLIEDGIDGLLCGTAGEIAARLELLLADPTLGPRLGEAGRAKVELRYTWDRVADRVLEVYRLVTKTQ